jgi:hypothetical protein
VHKSVKDFEMHGSSDLLEIVVSTLSLGAEHGVSFGRCEALKELLILNIVLAIVGVAIYISFA